jgi:hypothetical protein
MAKLLSGTRIYGNASIDSNLAINGTNASTSTTTGALVVGGGAGIAGSIYAGSILSTPISGSTGYFTTAQSTNLSSANVLIVGAQSTGNVNGALVVTGGVGVSGNIYTGGNIVVTGGITASTLNVAGGGLNGVAIGQTTPATGSFTTLTSTSTTTLNGNLVAASGTASSNTTTGALVVTGGAGITGAVNVGGAISAGGEILAGSGIASTSSSNGSLVVLGGAGVSGTLNIGGNLNVVGTAAVPTYTNPFVSNNGIATTEFVQNVSSWSMATVPLTNITAGHYSFASIGYNATITYTVTGGVISSVLVVSGGTSYYVGDLITITGGNFDSVVRVTSTNSGAVTGVQILYGGSGYANAAAATTFPTQPVASTYTLDGTLTANVIFIMPVGTYISGSNQWYIANNTTNTGSNTYDVKFYLTNGAGGAIGNGTTAIQGTSNSRITIIATDGINDLYSVNGQTYIAYQDVTDNGPENSDVLVVDFDPPFYQLTDGLTVGCGAVYINMTATPTLNVNGLGAYTIVKGTNAPLLVGDIGGNNHEMLMTYNLGTQTWVLQNPIFGVGTTGVQYHDIDDYQYFTVGTVTGSGFITEISGNVMYPEGEYVYQGSSWADATATGTIQSYFSGNSILVIEGSTLTSNGLTNSTSIWNLGQPVYGANSGSHATLVSANLLQTTDTLYVEFTNPYRQLLDGLTVGSGFQYINQTSTPTLDADGLGAYPIVKGVNVPLLPGDIGGNNHEGLLTYNLGTQTWVLQNPIFGVATTGVQYIDAGGTSDVLTMDFAVPYQVLLDGLTVGGGAQYVNQTTTPTLNVDGLGAYTIVKGANYPLLVGDIGGNNHEMLLTFNLGTTTWVLQNPIFGVGSIGLSYQDIDDYQYFTANIVHGTFITADSNNPSYPNGEIVYQGTSLATATAYGYADFFATFNNTANTFSIADSVFTANYNPATGAGTNFFGIWDIGQNIYGANSGAIANLYAFQLTSTTDSLEVDHTIPYQALLDGLTIGAGAQYPNQTTTPQILVDGFGPYTITKGPNAPLLPGDISGANHELILTFNLGTLTWVLQNPTFSPSTVGTLYSDDYGTVNNIVARFNPPFQYPIEGMLINVNASYINTSTNVTMKIDGLPAFPVVRAGANSVLIGDIQAANYYSIFTWDDDAQAWQIINPYNFGGNSVVAYGQTPSTSTTTGALVVTGGAGISGNVYAGSVHGTTVYDNGNRVITNLSSSGAGNISITGSIPSLTIGLPATGTGAQSSVGSSTSIPVLSTDAYGRVISLSSVTRSTVFPTLNTTGNTYIDTGPTITGVATLTNETDSTGTGAGALVVAGGIGVAKTGYFGGDLHVLGNLYTVNTISTGTITASVVNTLLYLGESNPAPYNFDVGVYSLSTDPLDSNRTQYFGLVRNHTNDYWTFFSNANTQPTANTTVNFTEGNIIYDTIKAGGALLVNTTVSTSTTTGALIVDGGVGIAGNVYAGAVYTDHNYFANGTPFATTTLQNSSEITSSAASGFNVQLNLATTGVTPGVYGSNVSIPTIVVDSKGRITSLTSNAVSSSLALAGTGYSTGAVSLLNQTLTFAGQYGVTAVTSGNVVTISTSQDLEASASPTFGNVTVTNTLQVAALEVGTNSSAGTTTLAGATVLGGGLRVYTATSADGQDTYTDLRYNPSSGATLLSTKASALYLQYDHGTGGVVFGNGAGSEVGYVDASGNANFVGAITQAGSQVLTAANYNSYAPSNSGQGATGTWNISITGTTGNASAASLTGTYLATGVTTSSLNTLGTLLSLNVSGTTTAGGLVNASAGLVASYVYAGTIGNVGAILNGVIYTAAQPNVTSLGTLTGLTVSGTTTLTGTANIATTNVVTANAITSYSSNLSTGNAQISGGAITSTPISGSTGSFTTLTASGVSKFNSNVVAASGTASSSTTTGALVVTGGAGITGAVYAGSIYTNNQYFANGAPYVSTILTSDPTITAIQANVIAANAAIVTANTGVVSYVNTIQSGINANVTAANAAIVTANTGVVSYINSINATLNAAITANINATDVLIITANTGVVSYVNSLNTGMAANVNAANAAIVTANAGVISYITTQLGVVDGYITANTNAANAAIVTANAGVISYITTQLGVVDGYITANTNAANTAIVTANTGVVSYVNSLNSSMITNVNAANTAITTANTGVVSYVNTLNSALNTAMMANVAAANAAIVTANAGVVSYVTSQITSLIGGAPAALDTLNLIAANLAADANSIGTIISGLTAVNANVVAANASVAAVSAAWSANASNQETEMSGLRANINAANTAIVTANTSVVSYIGTQVSLIDGYIIANVNAANTAIVTANTGVVSYVNSIATATNVAIVTANTGVVAYVNSLNSGMVSNLTTANSAVVSYVNAQDTIITNWMIANVAAANANTLTTVTTAYNNLTAYVDGETGPINASITAANAAIATLQTNQALLQTEVYSNANVAAYLTTNAQNIAGGNLYLSGNIVANEIYVNELFYPNGYPYSTSTTGTTGNLTYGITASTANSAVILNTGIYFNQANISTLLTLIDSVETTGNTTISWDLTSVDYTNSYYEKAQIDAVTDGVIVQYTEYNNITNTASTPLTTYQVILSGSEGYVQLWASGLSNNVNVAFKRKLLGSYTPYGYVLSSTSGNGSVLQNVVTSPTIYSAQATINNIATIIDTFPVTGIQSVSWKLSSSDIVNGKYSKSSIDAVLAGSPTDSANLAIKTNEYGTVETSSGLRAATFTSNITSDGNISLWATGVSSVVSVTYERTQLGTATPTGYTLGYVNSSNVVTPTTGMYFGNVSFTSTNLQNNNPNILIDTIPVSGNTSVTWQLAGSTIANVILQSGQGAGGTSTGNVYSRTTIRAITDGTNVYSTQTDDISNLNIDIANFVALKTNDGNITLYATGVASNTDTFIAFERSAIGSNTVPGYTTSSFGTVSTSTGLAIGTGSSGLTPADVVANTVGSTVIDTLDASQFTTAKYLVQATFAGNVHSTEMLVISNGLVAGISEYATLFTSTELFTSDAEVTNTGIIVVTVQPTNPGTVFDYKRYELVSRINTISPVGDLLLEAGNDDLMVDYGDTDLLILTGVLDLL